MQGMNVTTEANAHYMALKDDAVACAKIRKEAKTLAVAILTDPNACTTITSATVNGQSFTSRDSMTQTERLKLLREIIRRLDHGGPISGFQRIAF